MLSSAHIRLFVIILLSLTRCDENNLPNYNIPSSPELRDGCKWANAELSVFDNKNKIVKFRHQSCLEPKYESISVDSNGNDVHKLSFDVVTGSFSIFEQQAFSQEAFVQELVDKSLRHNGICIPKWKIDDGKKHNAEIKFMPCGHYGRNYSGETIFVFNDGIVLNLEVSGDANDIDFSSISYVIQN